jgi:hypothetical protein
MIPPTPGGLAPTLQRRSKGGRSAPRVLAETMIKVLATPRLLGILLLACIPSSQDAAAAEGLINGGSVTGYLAGPDQVDVYRFEAADGENVEVRATAASAQLRMWVYDDAGMQVGVDDNSTTVAVRSYDLNAGTGEIHLMLSSGSGEPPTSYQLHFAQMPGANEHGTPSLSGAVFNEVIDVGDLDSYTFDANAGETVHVRMLDTTDDGGYPYSFRPDLRIYGVDGRLVAQHGDYDVAAVRFQADATGTYTIVASDDLYDPGAGGPYQLRVTRAPLDADGPVLINDGSVDGFMAPGDLDAYVFTARAGEGIQVRIVDLDNAGPQASYIPFYPGISVYDPFGATVRIPDNEEDYQVAGFGFEAPYDGRYTVVVRDESSYRDKGGNYRINFTRAPGAGLDSPLFNGQTVTGSIVAGELDAYTFEARVGDTIWLEGSDTPDLYQARKHIYDPSGHWVSAPRLDHRSLVVAEQTGRYTVVIADDSSYLDGAGTYTLSLEIERTGLSYAALGDSYSAGEGVRPYAPLGQPWDEGCHRSTRAYARQLRMPGTSTPIAQRGDALFDFHACTGAVTDNLRPSGEGQYGEPPQLAAVNHIDSTRDLVTLSLGGNDAHFADILKFCLAHDACHEIEPFQPYSDIQLGDLFPLLAAVVEVKLLEVFAELRSATPNATTLVLGYPLVVGGTECAAVQVPFAEDFALSESEQAWMREATGLMNTLVQAAAVARGLHFVPVADHFDGHEVCGRYDDWILGLNLIDPVRLWDPNASFHPTARGQYELGRVANAYLESTSVGWPFGYHASGLPRNPPPVLPSASKAALQVPAGPLPSLGGLGLSLVDAPAVCAGVGGTLFPGAAVAIHGGGFAPDDSLQVSLKLAADAGLALGSVAADADGVLDAVIDLPEALPPGAQGVLQVLGAGPDGVGRLLLARVQVQSPLSVDADGEGVPDSCDNCPGVANADQGDSDYDGWGDACDPCLQDPDNDTDGDSLCAGQDACPFDPDNDGDGDGRCAIEDSCPSIDNPDQADRDGDGLGNACDSDDDNDGLADVYETGTGLYVSPTDTGTDPLNGDSDADGVDDFEEIQRGSDPNIPSVTLQIPLTTGLNLFSYPFANDGNPRLCSEFLDQLGDAAEVSTILQLDAATQHFVTCDRATSAPFTMTPGEGYVVHSHVALNAPLSGQVICPPLTLAPGINLVGNPAPAADSTCHGLLDALASHGVKTIQRHDRASGRFEGCSLDDGSGAAVGADFAILQGEGYLVHGTASIQMAWPGCAP